MNHFPASGSQHTGLVARIDAPGKRPVWKPVVTFVDGEAMILGSNRRLTPADEQAGYAGLKAVPVAVGAIPAEPGLRVRHWHPGERDGDKRKPGYTWTDPVVGWLAFSDGSTLPLLAVGPVGPESWHLIYQDGTESDGGEALDFMIPWCEKCAAFDRRYTPEGELCPTCHADHPNHGGREKTASTVSEG
ncbi:hypothetical protein [Kitasatospora sp. NPDC004272]